MGTVQIEGLGLVEIAGDVPTQDEARRIKAALTARQPAEAGADEPAFRFERAPAERGFFGSLASGAEFGFKEIGAGVLQAVSRAGEALGFEPSEEFKSDLDRVLLNEQMRFESTTRDFPITGEVGRAGGQLAAFPAGGVTVRGAALTGAAAGALQPTEAADDDTERAFNTLIGGASGGIFQAALPSAVALLRRGANKTGAVAKSLFESITGRKVPAGSFDDAGNPTAALVKTLEESGLTTQELDTFTNIVTSRKADEFVDIVAARQARFAEQGIPAKLGDITQDFSQQATEQRLISMAGGEAGEPLRQLVLQQSEAFSGKVTELVDSLGIPKRAGNSIKAALTGRKKILRGEKNALYNRAAEAAPDVLTVPIFVDEIEAALPAPATARRIGRIAGSQMDALDSLLVEFGINKSDDAVAKFTEGGGEVIPMTLGSFEEFRAALNQIERSDTTRATSVIIAPIKEALDNEAMFVNDAVKKAGVTDEGVLDILEQARSRVRELKTEFSPQAISGRLTGVRRDGVTPVIEASQVATELLRPGAPIENLQKTLQNLAKSGEPGKIAIQDLRAAVIMNALDVALQAPSRKTSGIQTISGNQFAKSLDKFGPDKLKLLFSGDRQALKVLEGLKQTGLDIEPASAATPKGSAPVILDIMRRMGRLPGLAAAVDAVDFVVKAGADDRAVAKSLKAKPEIAKTLEDFDRDFAGIASAIGVREFLIRVRELQENN